jgi:ABC-type phosphate transport system permease subunit
MIGIVACCWSFIVWQGIQLFVKDGVPGADLLLDLASGSRRRADNFGLLPFIAGTVVVTAARC